MTTIISLKQEIKPYINTLVLNHFNVVRLVDDIHDDGEDWYWVFDGTYPRIMNMERTIERGIHYSSCVGGWTPLKGHLPDKDYNELVRIWNLNNEKKVI